ncbi:MAG: 3-methyl-2-oxobutanoate dehydrogenase subunit beta, partial [Eubacteriales bacterium]|nr:3-methyl-2-oxobutanoate dehydrogenase subunit beta [Eubacteriales bacterium]
HGDYRLVVLAPANLQEAVELTQEGFDIADTYRMPVMMMGDGMLGQMMEPVEFGTYTPRKVPEKSWATVGRGQRDHNNIVNSLYIKPDVLEKVNQRLEKLYAEVAEKETKVELYNTEGADLICVAYGTTSRIVRNVITQAAKEGLKIGLVRPITLWPFPTEALYNAANQPSVKGVLSVEMSLGQMVDDVKIAVNGAKPVSFYGRTGGMIPMPRDILAYIKSFLGGKA